MCDDIVLAFAEACEWLVEALRPHMRAALRRDQLGADPHPRADPAHAAFENIAHAELVANVADVERLAAEGERGLPRYDERTRKMREISR
jgi:hypothetical protein